VCVPEEAQLVLDLPAGRAAASAHARQIAAFAARVPQPGERFGWKVEQASLVPAQGANGHLELVVEIVSRHAPFRAPELVAEGAERQHFGLSSVRLGADRSRARFVLPYRRSGEPAGHKADAPAGEIALTLLDGERSGTFLVRVGGLQR
jgi:suppressor for copper-sensitivity B